MSMYCYRILLIFFFNKFNAFRKFTIFSICVKRRTPKPATQTRGEGNPKQPMGWVLFCTSLALLSFLSLFPSPAQGYWYAEHVYADKQCASLERMRVYELGRCVYDVEGGGYRVYVHSNDAVVMRTCYDDQCSM